MAPRPPAPQRPLPETPDTPPLSMGSYQSSTQAHPWGPAGTPPLNQSRTTQAHRDPPPNRESAITPLQPPKDPQCLTVPPSPRAPHPAAGSTGIQQVLYSNFFSPQKYKRKGGRDTDGGLGGGKKGYNKNQHSHPHSFPPTPHPAPVWDLGRRGSTCTGKKMLTAPKPAPSCPEPRAPPQCPPAPFPASHPAAGRREEGPPALGPGTCRCVLGQKPLDLGLIERLRANG